jgi:general secretion pathway protein C
VARSSEILPFWVSLLLAIAIGYYAARIAWELAPGPVETPWSPPMITGTPAATQSAATSSYAAIVEAHLFGRAEVTEEPATAAVEDAPDTQLSLQLRGAVAAADERFAHAIIADNTGTEKVYFVKDNVPGGAVVQGIQPDRIVLRRGGALEVLRLPRDSGSDSPGAARRAVPPPVPRRAELPSMQEVVTQNANSFTEIIRPQPFMPNGELKGYRIYPGRNREQFIALGLQPGDLVTEINGMTLNNPAQAMEMFRSLADTTQVTVSIEREGQTQSLTLDTSQLSAAGSGVTQ